MSPEQRASLLDDVTSGDQQTSAMLEELMKLISHELMTPLAIIEATATLALDQVGDDTEAERRELLEVIRRNTELASLVLRRLSLARDIDAGKVQLDRSVLDLGRLVRESVADLDRVVLAGHPVEVTVAAGPRIEADVTATREIVFNLLSNAAKYSEEGAAITVTVTTSGDTAEVVVRNHGGGVTPGDSERIFDKFAQGDRQSPGAGLGLFVSRGLARAHGGDLCVQPARDVGSEFHLTLPVCAAA
jgi:signal transduction histidine kinase